MDLNIKWHQPVVMVDGEDVDLILNIEELDDIHEGPGIYMFCRRFDADLKPLYIGKSGNVYKRIKQHLNSVKMMKGIQNSQRGEKVLIVGEFVAKPGQQPDKAITIIESSLIEHAILNGYELLNELGTKRPTHQINFKGLMSAKQFSGSKLTVRA